METGIIGLPLSGKTTIFNALTGQQVGLSGAGGGKRQAHVAEIEVPDERVEKLGTLFKSKKSVHATVRFLDVPAELGPEGSFSASSLAEVRNTDAVTIVVRAFSAEGVAHPLRDVDPCRDLHRVMESLVFGDYEVAEKRLERLTKEGKRSSRESQLLSGISETLSSGSLIGEAVLSEEDRRLLSGYRFLTARPILVIANTGPEEATVDLEGLRRVVSELKLSLFPIRGDLEMEIAQLEPSDQKAFLADLGLEESAKNRYLREIYSRLDLISFLTAGETEVHAWSIPRGSTALTAAGRIHSDMENGFIRAEVIPWEELLDAGGYAEARKLGRLRLEGKTYTVQDGDVLTIRFNI